MPWNDLIGFTKEIEDWGLKNEIDKRYNLTMRSTYVMEETLLLHRAVINKDYDAIERRIGSVYINLVLLGILDMSALYEKKIIEAHTFLYHCEYFRGDDLLECRITNIYCNIAHTNEIQIPTLFKEVLIELKIICEMKGFDIEDCIRLAYRKGGLEYEKEYVVSSVTNFKETNKNK